MKLPKSLEKVLSEKDQKDIKAEFDKQVEIAVESALHLYDDEAIKRIDALVEQINESHKVKLMSLVTKQKNREKSLCESIREKYERTLLTEADKFKVSLASNIEKFIESKINNIVDYSVIKEAAKNNTAKVVLNSMRQQLGIDSALMRESVSKPILEGKKQLEQYRKYIKQLKQHNEQLNESLNSTKANLILENKLSSLPQDAADHMRRVLGGKDTKFINEQFNYVLDLYRDNKNKQRSLLKEEALRQQGQRKNRIVEPKRTRDLIMESKNTEDDQLIDDILQEMAPKI